MKTSSDVEPSEAESMVYETRGLAKEIYTMREAAEAEKRPRLMTWPVREVKQWKVLETLDEQMSALRRTFGRTAGSGGPWLHGVNRDDK
jgi:hypothetical protein